MNALYSAFNLGSLRECRDETVRVRTGPARTGESERSFRECQEEAASALTCLACVDESEEVYPEQVRVTKVREVAWSGSRFRVLEGKES